MPEVWSEIERALAKTARAAEQAERPRLVALRLSPRLSGARILVVDADPAWISEAEALGVRQLFEIVPAATVREALERARETRIDGAIVDLGLEPPDGALRLARELRALPGREALPIAVSAARGAVEERVAAAHAGASLFLTRPFDAEAFGTAVRELVSARREAPPLALIATGDEGFVTRAEAALRSAGLDVTALRHPARLLEALEETQPAVLVMDDAMPVLGGLDACRMLGATPRWQDLPILLHATSAGVATRVAAFRSGADDFLAEPLEGDELVARVEVRLEGARLLRARLERDPLTGLLVRRPFLAALAARVAEADRTGRPLALCLIDLDDLRAVNERHGPLAGERVVAGLGRLLTSRFRAEDLRGRRGGGEFVLAFTGATAQTIHGALLRVQAEFNALAFEGEAGRPFPARFSAGLASYPEDAVSVRDLLQAADGRLTAAKRAGKNGIVSSG